MKICSVLHDTLIKRKLIILVYNTEKDIFFTIMIKKTNVRKFQRL